MDDELQSLQQLIARSLEPLGCVSVSVVCRTVHKVLVTHRAGGVGVRVLICRDSEKGRPFVNVMPIVDGKSEVDEGHSFRGLQSNGSDLEPVVETIKAAFEMALKAAHLH